jgi:exonuclease III
MRIARPAGPADGSGRGPAASPPLRVVAYNFLSGGSPARSGHWSRLLRDLAADVVLAQECRPPGDSPGERFRPGPTDTFLWRPAPARRWGSAILLRGVAAAPLTLPGFAGWVVGAELDGSFWGSGRPLRLFGIHCPAGEGGYVRTMHRILDRLAPLRAGAELVLGGDFNVVVGRRGPSEPVPVSRGELGILDRLAEEFRLVSCWQAANPGRALAQTLRWSADRHAPYHCDGIFVPSAWAAGIVRCRVVAGARWARLSDHNPVLAELAAGARGG